MQNEHRNEAENMTAEAHVLSPFEIVFNQKADQAVAFIDRFFVTPLIGAAPRDEASDY